MHYMNIALFSIDTSLALISLVIFCISMLIALIFLIKMIGTKITYNKAKKHYPERIPVLKKELKKYTVIFAMAFILGFGQYIGVICLYGIVMSHGKY